MPSARCGCKGCRGCDYAGALLDLKIAYNGGGNFYLGGKTKESTSDLHML